MSGFLSKRNVRVAISELMQEGADQESSKRCISLRCAVAPVALGAAVALAGCAGDHHSGKSSSTKEMLVTRDALVSTFSACLLPGFGGVRSSADLRFAGGCRLR